MIFILRAAEKSIDHLVFYFDAGSLTDLIYKRDLFSVLTETADFSA